MTKKQSSVAVIEKPRYNDIFANGEEETGEGVRSARVAVRGVDATGPPAAPVMISSTPARREDPEDIDRPTRRTSPDFLSEQIGDPEYRSGVSFEWSRTGMGTLHVYSRRYSRLNLIVDLFANDNPAMRAEVAQKRARLIAHNDAARADLAGIEAHYAQLMKQAKSEAAREVAEQWKTAAFTYRRREGLMAYGYLPILANTRYPDVEDAKRGDVLDLPPPRAKEDHPVGGVGVQSRYV